MTDEIAHKSRTCLESVMICEVGPRDGLQNEQGLLTLDLKEKLIHDLVDSGIRQIEIGSFVSPKAVPTMADTDQLLERLKSHYHSKHKRTEKGFLDKSPLFLGLIVNEKGLERAISAGVDGVCIVAVVSDSLSAKNNRCSARESFDTAVFLLKQAKSHGLFTRIDIATAWNCPYEGEIFLDKVTPLADRIWEDMPDEMAFCDSIGHADPFRVAKLFDFFGKRYGSERLVAHFHDTKGLGLANAAAALMTGVRRFDASIGGLGGCPFAPGAKGNLATEDLIHLVHECGLQTGIDLNHLWKLVDFCKLALGKNHLGGQTASWFQSLLKDPDKNKENTCRSRLSSITQDIHPTH
jgi:hydroxymethylglutaryl-CoA lyase